MKRTFILLSLLVPLCVMYQACTKKAGAPFDRLEETRTTILLDDQWRFLKGDQPGAESDGFDDSSWRLLDLPHDWSIEDLPGSGSPLDPEAPGGISTGYYLGGTGWYRKTLDVPRFLQGKRFCLMFEGVYMNADVWVNGTHVGSHPYGYTSFWFDITDQLVPGEENLISVRVANEGRNSRWYSGSGIYRHVWLTITEPVHVAPWGTFVTTPVAESSGATVMITSEVENNTGQTGQVTVETTLLDPSGTSVASRQDLLELGPDGTTRITQEVQVTAPALWSVDDPGLYTALIEISDRSGKKLDQVETTFGIRSIAFTTNGFTLNGMVLLMKGGCMHHDNGPLGAAAYDRAEERRVELMKASGFNAIRCAHNPPSPAFLDACDRLGMLVIDEAFDMWRREKNPQDYHLYFDEWWERDIRSMVLRDRNHPSVIMWSTGNEIPERGEPEGVETSARLAQIIRDLDPTRPVTSAVNGLGPDKDPYFATLDLSGYNYPFSGDYDRESTYSVDHRRVPDRIMYCSESFPLVAYGAWMETLEYPYVLGDFVWTGFDYLGEASIGWRGYPHEGSFYPWNHAFCGDIDICGLKRPQSYYRNILWNAGRQLSLFVTPPVPSFEENPDREEWSKWHWQDVVERWDWPGYEGEPLQVEVYSSSDEVELILNGNPLGRKPTTKETEWIARWKVPYQPGELKAVGYRNGEAVEEWSLVTPSTPSRIGLTADRNRIAASGQDLSYVQVELLDGEGNLCVVAEDLVRFEVSGPGTIVAVGSSNPMSAESFQQPKRKAYQGRCLVVVKSSKDAGEITLKAMADGLETGVIQIESINEAL